MAKRFTQSDVTRALKAAQAAGLEVQRVRIDCDGAITLVVGGEAVDDPLEDELRQFEQRHGQDRA